MYCEHLNYIEIRCLKVSIKQLLLRLFNQKVKKKKKKKKKKKIEERGKSTHNYII
jgi:hypothetical protein